MPSQPSALSEKVRLFRRFGMSWDAFGMRMAATQGFSRSTSSLTSGSERVTRVWT